VPLDVDTVRASVRKTAAAVIVGRGARNVLGWSEIGALIARTRRRFAP